MAEQNSRYEAPIYAGKNRTNSLLNATQESSRQKRKKEIETRVKT